jgi:hypothetical protein
MTSLDHDPGHARADAARVAVRAIVMVPDSLPVGTAVDDLLVLDGCATEADWAA